MKSYVIRNEDRKRAEDYAKRKTEAMQQTYIKLILKLIALELNKLYGHGKIRFSRVLCALTKDLEEIGNDYGLDCVMVKLDDELRKIGIVDKNGDWNFEEKSNDIRRSKEKN